jgi:hypothetical protein
MKRALLTGLLTLQALLLPASSHGEAPSPYRALPALDLRVFRCSPNPGHCVIASDADVAQAVQDFSSHCHQPGFQALMAGFLSSLKAANLSWDRESLVVVSEWYGTGMATGRLKLGQSRPGVVNARIVWTVPPPPVTPDTTVFRAAFAVRKDAVTAVSVTGKDGRPVVLPVRD